MQAHAGTCDLECDRQRLALGNQASSLGRFSGPTRANHSSNESQSTQAMRANRKWTGNARRSTRALERLEANKVACI